MQKIICFLCCLLLGTSAVAHQSIDPAQTLKEIAIDEIIFQPTSLEENARLLQQEAKAHGIDLQVEYLASPSQRNAFSQKSFFGNINFATAARFLGRSHGLETEFFAESEQGSFRLVFYKKVVVQSIKVHAAPSYYYHGSTPFSFADFQAQKTTPKTIIATYDISGDEHNPLAYQLDQLIAAGAKVMERKPSSEERFYLLAEVSTNMGPIYFGVSTHLYFGFLNLQLPEKSPGSGMFFYELTLRLPERHSFQFETMGRYLRPLEDGPSRKDNSIVLGDGYEAVTVEKVITPEIAHTSRWTHLQHGKELSPPIGLYALSPNERQVVYQDLSTGKILLLDKPTHRKTELCSTFPGLVLRFDWPDNVETIRVELYNKEPIFLNPSVGAKENTASEKPSSAD